MINESGEPRHLKVERQEYASAAVTAHYLTTVAEFRALFSRDLLKRGTPLKVSRVSLLFTDLTGSTALYASVGDAAAFRFVDDHFDVLRGAVAAAGGTVVKTMGDAVMAAFVDDASCARAAFACLVAFDAFRRKTPHAEVTQIKLGIHGGPCYVVTANGTLDFFGQTVNVAARLQGLAESGEVVLEAAALERLSAEARAGLVVSAPFQAKVKGVAEAAGAGAGQARGLRNLSPSPPRGRGVARPFRAIRSPRAESRGNLVSASREAVTNGPGVPRRNQARGDGRQPSGAMRATQARARCHLGAAGSSGRADGLAERRRDSVGTRQRVPGCTSTSPPPTPRWLCWMRPSSRPHSRVVNEAS